MKYDDRLVNNLMAQLAINPVSAEYISIVARAISGKSNDLVLWVAAEHMLDFGMNGVDQLLDGYLGGIESFGDQLNFVTYLAHRTLEKQLDLL